MDELDTDFADGNFEALKTAIQTRLFRLPGDSIVLPGHGEPTTVEAEKQHNPFVGIPAGYFDESPR